MGVSHTQQIPDPQEEKSLFSHRVTEFSPDVMLPSGACIHADAGQPHGRDTVEIIYSLSRRLD